MHHDRFPVYIDVVHQPGQRPARNAGRNEDEMTIELDKMTMSDGYVGGMGVTWETPTAANLEAAIIGAMEIEAKSRDEIIAILESGNAVRWCKSANFYYDHSYGKIGRKKVSPPVVMVECDLVPLTTLADWFNNAASLRPADG